jgi:hypothetical protein
MATTLRPPRAEFGWIYLQSLIATAEQRFESERARNHRLRAWRASRRLRELREYEARRHLPPGSGQPPPRTALAVSSAALACAVLALGLMASVSSDGSVPVIADIALLALALIWFVLSVACAGRSVPRRPAPEPLDEDGERLPLWDWFEKPSPPSAGS